MALRTGFAPRHVPVKGSVRNPNGHLSARHLKRVNFSCQNCQKEVSSKLSQPPVQAVSHNPGGVPAVFRPQRNTVTRHKIHSSQNRLVGCHRTHLDGPGDCAVCHSREGVGGRRFNFPVSCEQKTKKRLMKNLMS